MTIKTLLFLSFCLLADLSLAALPFEPKLVESDGSPVCSVALEHYKEIFLSKYQQTKPIESSTGIFIPTFEPLPRNGIRGEAKSAKIQINNTEKLIVYYSRSHSWRGDIYTGYMIDSAQLGALMEQLESEPKIPHFYPMGDLAYGSDFTWWENLPFRHDDKWYVLGDYGDFDRHDSIRHVYEILPDSQAKKVCAIKIFENFNTDTQGQRLPFFSAYQKTLKKMLLSPGDCGTSHPEAYAASNGQFFASMAVVRPWAVTATWGRVSSYRNESRFQKKHFEHWKYQDIWSYREQETFSNLKPDAINELKKYYMDEFAYKEKDASEMAAGVIEYLPGHYYSLGVYYDEGKDFSPFQKLLEGTYQDWPNLLKEMQLRYGSLSPVVLTLALDIPQNFKKLPPEIKPESILTSYEKDLLMFAAHMNNYDTVKYLVDSGWPVNSVTAAEKDYCGNGMDRTGRSALTYAAENASIHLIKYLVKAGADIDIKDSKGNSLDFYIKNNPRFTNEEKNLGFKALLTKYNENSDMAPGFSCKNKLNRIESAVCASASLSIYDRELLDAYRRVAKFESFSKTLKASQIEWIKNRNKTCGSYEDASQMAACIARSTRARTRYLEYLESAFGENTERL